jgi:hypothetical protein
MTLYKAPREQGYWYGSGSSGVSEAVVRERLRIAQILRANPALTALEIAVALEKGYNTP